MGFRLLAGALGFLTLTLLFNPAYATESPAMSGRPKPLLNLIWQNEQGHQEKVRLDLARLDALPQLKRELKLPTPLGIADKHQWQGISLRELIALSGQQPKAMRMMALNGYFASVPVADIEQFDPILAYRRDGQNLTIRDKGPFILIYPFDDFTELNQQVYINRSVWQIHEIHLE